MNIRTEIIAHNSDAYREVVALRYRIMREPLGLTFPPEMLAAESENTHLAVYVEDRLAGCLMLERQDVDTVKMRQVAVDTALQGKGFGRILVTFAEQVAHSQGYKNIRLMARETAVPFYARLGYTAVGEIFEEVTLPHQEMRKNLLPEAKSTE